MDTLDIKELLSASFGEAFDFHPDFVDEFSSLIKKSGSEKQVIAQFLNRLDAIIQLGNIDYGPKWIEKLKNYDNMYSLHIDAARTNYRLLFSKNKNGKYFLHVFYEKSGKINTSYAAHVPIAIKRRDETKS